MTTSTNITDYVFRAIPNGGNNYGHLNMGAPVAITVAGAKEHNEHHQFGKMAATAGLGAFLLGTSGLGFGVVGSFGAMGIGAVELAVAGSGLGALTGNMLNKNLRSQGQSAQFKNTKVLGMVGFVKEFGTHWWDTECKVVRVKWYICDENGVLTSEDSWHLPEHLVSLESRAVAEERERKQREAEERARREALARKNKAQATVREASNATQSTHGGIAGALAALVAIVGLGASIAGEISTTVNQSAPIERTY